MKNLPLLLILILAGTAGADSNLATLMFASWLSVSSVGDYNGDGICNFQDFAIAAGDDWFKAGVIWGKDIDTCRQNFAAYIADAEDYLQTLDLNSYGHYCTANVLDSWKLAYSNLGE
jgi:hypothetical protein